ncbi:antitoxin [Pseudonocardia nigra]|uniref:antitoxin n=1 Tax=Pseudonocardia nigra TaxID=1921578 RepID=UPI001C5E7AA9|nr:antitoxin [Pseudonocardia nigra]
MGLTDKAKELADTALEYAGKAGEKAAQLSGAAREKAPGYVDRAAELADRAVDAATSRVDQATGGRFHERLDSARTKVGEALDQPRPAATEGEGEGIVPGSVTDVAGQTGAPITPAATNPDAVDAPPKG